MAGGSSLRSEWRRGFRLAENGERGARRSEFIVEPLIRVLGFSSTGYPPAHSGLPKSKGRRADCGPPRATDGRRVILRCAQNDGAVLRVGEGMAKSPNKLGSPMNTRGFPDLSDSRTCSGLVKSASGGGHGQVPQQVGESDEYTWIPGPVGLPNLFGSCQIGEWGRAWPSPPTSWGVR